MTLRVNSRKTTSQQALTALESSGLKAREIAPEGAIELEKPCPVSQIPGFFDGHFSVQDAAAQWCAHLFDLPQTARVLDACSAPGGKTGHLLERFDLDTLVACDVSEGRLAKTHENLQRLDLSATLTVCDARNIDAGTFDAILLDAPCSGTGVIRRNPDSRLSMSPEQLDANIDIQRELLDHLWQALKPSGQLLYATCSVLPQENSRQIEQFLQRTPDAADHTPQIPETRGEVGRQRLPGDSGDGFYYALLVKSPA